MRIVYLLESAANLWGGVKIALHGANLMVERGHEVVVLSKTQAPDWIELSCEFRRVPDFKPDHIPVADLIVGTDWSTVPFAVDCGKGAPVHFVQGYEGCMDRNRHLWEPIDETFQLPIPKITISRHLETILRDRFDCTAMLLPNMIDHRVMFPAVPPKPRVKPVRVGLVGPYQIDWKDIPTALEACDIATRSGLDLELVRITNTVPAPEEQDLPYPVEWHVRVPPNEMGALYRSMDALVAPSQGQEEGFYLPAIEAMACGVPCVLTDIPCFHEYADEQYALFVPPRDPLEMAQALVIASSHDPVRESLREAGLRTAAPYTVAAHADALELALTDILARARPVITKSAEVAVAGGLTDENLSGLSSNIGRALMAACDAYVSVKDYAGALQHIQAAVDIQPDDLDLLQQLGYVRYLGGDDAGALAVYDDLIERGQKSWGVLANKGMVQVSRGDYVGAVESLEGSIATGGQSAENLNNLGVALHRLGDPRQASMRFAQALQLDPGYAEAAANLQDLRSVAGPA